MERNDTMAEMHQMAIHLRQIQFLDQSLFHSLSVCGEQGQAWRPDPVPRGATLVRHDQGILMRYNIELSCAAESSARSEPQQRHSYEREGHFRRQLQRFVSHHPAGLTVLLQGMA